MVPTHCIIFRAFQAGTRASLTNLRNRPASPPRRRNGIAAHGIRFGVPCGEADGIFALCFCRVKTLRSLMPSLAARRASPMTGTRARLSRRSGGSDRLYGRSLIAHRAVWCDSGERSRFRYWTHGRLRRQQDTDLQERGPGPAPASALSPCVFRGLRSQSADVERVAPQGGALGGRGDQSLPLFGCSSSVAASSLSRHLPKAVKRPLNED